MGKKSKVQSQSPSSSKWESLPWKSVQVGKEVEDASNADVNGKLWTSNHYDNPRAKGTDLYDDNSKGGFDYMDGANDPGIFLGLEVIDGSQYEVEKIPIGIGSKGTEKKGFISRLKINDASSEFVKDEVEPT